MIILTRHKYLGCQMCRHGCAHKMDAGELLHVGLFCTDAGSVL